MLYRDRSLIIVRRDIAPIWTRSFPVSMEPHTIGEHLRKRRFSLGLRQSQAAEQLKVSQLTLSLWERDCVHPSWSQQPRIAAFLGYDPFDNPFLGRPKGNETADVAILAQNTPLSLSRQIKKCRMELRKTRKQCAKDLGVSSKTLWSWETGRRNPPRSQRLRLSHILGVALP